MATTAVIPAVGFIPGQSSVGPAFADYAVFEGTAGNDFYDSRQYSYKINQWASDYDAQNYDGYDHIPGYLASGFSPALNYFSATRSLRMGMTEYGEFATQANAGIAYGNGPSMWAQTESWASVAILQKYLVQGWLLQVNYTRAGVDRSILAYAVYSDFVNAECGRKVYSWFGGYPALNSAAVLTQGSLVPGYAGIPQSAGVIILYDSARLLVARASITIHDGYYNEDFAQVTLTLVMNKVTKTAIVYKDVKILLDPKVLDAITDFAFTERYELDLARVINPSNEAFIHYYGLKSGPAVGGYLLNEQNSTVYLHPLVGNNTFDSIQAYDVNRNFIFFSGIWPSATDYSVYGQLIPDLTHNYYGVLSGLGGVADGVVQANRTADILGIPNEPSTPWVVVQWRYSQAPGDWSGHNFANLLQFLAKASPDREIRFVETIGMTDYKSTGSFTKPYVAQDVQDGFPINQKDVEVSYLLDSVFNPVSRRHRL